MNLKYSNGNTLEEVADIMNLKGTLRWSDYGGNQDSDEGTILKVQSEVPFKLVVKDQKGDTHPFSSVEFAAVDEDVVYFTDGNWHRKMDGEIIRARQLII